MAGGGEDNPVAINVTAMVDVIFCLCLFFMCSMHFKQVEGKIDTWMPDKGDIRPLDRPPELQEVRVFMKTNPSTLATVRSVGNRPPVVSDDDLVKTMLSMASDYRRMGRASVPVLIDATSDVPWQDVIRVMDLCRSNKLDRIEFTAPPGY